MARRDEKATRAVKLLSYLLSTTNARNKCKMARKREKLVRAEMEKCEFDGRTLRLATHWLRGKKHIGC